jgi:hypothetical protein
LHIFLLNVLSSLSQSDAGEDLAMRFAVVVFAAALTGACANPAKFATSVEALASATKSAQSAMADIDADASKGFRRDLLAHAVANPRTVTWPDGQCQASSRECAVIVELDGKRYDLTDAQPSQIPKQLEVMAVMADYTQALELLAAAPDKAALDVAGEKVSKAIAKIAAVPSPISAVAVFAEPIGHAVAWLVGEAQDMAKMSALRKATAEMQTALAAVAPTLGESVDGLYVRRINEARLQFTEDQGKWRREASEANLNAYVAAAKALDAALIGRPKSTFEDLVELHGALAEAVAKGVAPDETLRTRISDFAERAKRAAAIARQFRDAAKTPNS